MRTNTPITRPISILTIVFGSLVATLANAISFPVGFNLVYEESYDQGTYALIADVDKMAGGPMVTSFITQLGNGVNAAPTLSGSSADLAISATPGPAIGERSGLQINGSLLTTNDFGLRGVFDDITLTRVGDGARNTANVAGVFGGTTAVSATFSHQQDLSGDVMVLSVVEQNSILQNFTLTPLGPSDIALILAGASFELDLLVDRGLGTATASLAVSGGSTTTTTPFALTLVGGGDLLTDLSQLGTITNEDLSQPFPFNADDSMTVRMDNFQVFSAVPEPSTSLLLALGLAGLSAHRRQRR